MMLIKAILAITGLTLASGSFAPKMAGKITPSELKFTFQMKDKFAGVNPKDRVKRETFIGTCTHYWFVSSKQFFLSPHFYLNCSLGGFHK